MTSGRRNDGACPQFIGGQERRTATQSAVRRSSEDGKNGAHKWIHGAALRRRFGFASGMTFGYRFLTKNIKQGRPLSRPSAHAIAQNGRTKNGEPRLRTPEALARNTGLAITA